MNKAPVERPPEIPYYDNCFDLCDQIAMAHRRSCPTGNLVGENPSMSEDASESADDAAATSHLWQRPATSLLPKLADEADICVILLDEHDRVIYTNAGCMKLLGYALTDMQGQTLTQLLGFDESLAQERLRAGVPHREQSQHEALVRTRDGDLIWVRARVRPSLDAEGKFLGLGMYLQDITDDKIQFLQREVLEEMVSDAPLGQIAELICRRAEALTLNLVCSVLRVDQNGRLQSLAAPSLPLPYVQAIDGLEIGPAVGACGTAAYTGEPVFVADISQDPLWAPYRSLPLPAHLGACWSSPIKLTNNRIVGTFAFYFPIGKGPEKLHQRIVDACVHLCALGIKRYEAELQINQLAYYDGLTGLANRNQLITAINGCLASSGTNNVALLCIDVDHFKDVNDTLGHSAGDQLLVEVARRLSAAMQNGEFIGRMGGDEFVVVLPDASTEDAAGTAKEILRTIAQPIVVGNLVLPISASIGISQHPQDGSSTDDLLMKGDVALYEAKRAGRGIYKHFAAEMTQVGEERVILSAALREALSARQLHLQYQPQVRISDGVIYGAEALARWVHPVLGVVEPSRFIPIAEECGIIDDLGIWALDEACLQIAKWHASGMRIPTISVNLSPLQFRNDDLPDLITEILRKHRLTPEMLTLEITEGAMMDAGPAAVKTLNAIHELGIRLSMDDFGTGYSSLSSLAAMPVRELKIDRTFISRIEQDESILAIVTAIIRIGQSLGMTVVAEGVETATQHQKLGQLGCHVSQGHFIGPPMDGEALANWLASYDMTRNRKAIDVTLAPSSRTQAHMARKAMTTHR
jgi:diguanylate cyclase (GGDEF)-like protein/PAS domain S-box-containing protein